MDGSQLLADARNLSQQIGRCRAFTRDVARDIGEAKLKGAQPRGGAACDGQAKQRHFSVVAEFQKLLENMGRLVSA